MIDSDSDKRQIGVVKFFNSKKGFGFISLITDAGKRDIFVHVSNLAPSCNGCLDEGQQVSFLVVKGKKGFEAKDISLEK